MKNVKTILMGLTLGLAISAVVSTANVQINSNHQVSIHPHQLIVMADEVDATIVAENTVVEEVVAPTTVDEVIHQPIFKADHSFDTLLANAVDAPKELITGDVNTWNYNAIPVNGVLYHTSEKRVNGNSVSYLHDFVRYYATTTVDGVTTVTYERYGSTDNRVNCVSYKLTNVMN